MSAGLSCLQDAIVAQVYRVMPCRTDCVVRYISPYCFVRSTRGSSNCAKVSTRAEAATVFMGEVHRLASSRPCAFHHFTLFNLDAIDLTTTTS